MVFLILVQTASDQAVHEHVVMKFTQPYLGKPKRNVTTDSYFSTVKLCERFKSQSTSLVGTLRRDRIEVPPTEKLGKQNLYSTILYVKYKDITLTVYQGKKNKNILLLSSLHNAVINDDNEKKPESVTYYNRKKYGVDILDQMIRLYSTKSGTCRWPIHVFFNVLDISATNAWILYKDVTGKNKLSSRNFVLQLSEELRAPCVSSRNTANARKPTEQRVNREDITIKKRSKCR
ncbi:hypothetical protein AVEN_212002-1, partial [Araneus ventricosus]